MAKQNVLWNNIHNQNPRWKRNSQRSNLTNRWNPKGHLRGNERHPDRLRVKSRHLDLPLPNLRLRDQCLENHRNQTLEALNSHLERSALNLNNPQEQGHQRRVAPLVQVRPGLGHIRLPLTPRRNPQTLPTRLPRAFKHNFKC